MVLLVDSGAGRMMISRGAAARLGIDYAHPVRRDPVVGVGGALSFPVVRLDRVRVGGAVVPNLLASVYDLPPLFRADGVIGLNYLSRFRGTLEFDTRELILRPLRSRYASRPV